MKTRGVVIHSLPGPHSRSEARFGTKKIAAGMSFSPRHPHPPPSHFLDENAEVLRPHLSSLLAWAAETLTQEIYFVLVLPTAHMGDIAIQSLTLPPLAVASDSFSTQLSQQSLPRDLGCGNEPCSRAWLLSGRSAGPVGGAQRGSFSTLWRMED